MDVPERRSSFTPLRLLIGALVLGGGVTALGLIFGGGGANAAEPPAPDPLGSVVSSVTGTVGGTAQAVTSAVAPALPDPVRATVAQLVQPVTQVFDHAAEAAPVAAVVTPVASTVDQVVAATPVSQLPIVGAALGATPVEALTSPVSAAADDALSGVSTALRTAVAPIAPLVSQPPAVDTPTAGAPIGDGFATAATVVTGAVARASLDSGPPLSSVTPPLGSGSSAASAPGGAPPGGSGLPSPGVPSGSPGAGSSGGSSGGAAPSVAVTADAFAAEASTRAGRAALPAGDALPASPLFDHDISPD